MQARLLLADISPFIHQFAPSLQHCRNAMPAMQPIPCARRMTYIGSCTQSHTQSHTDTHIRTSQQPPSVQTSRQVAADGHVFETDRNEKGSNDKRAPQPLRLLGHTYSEYAKQHAQAPLRSSISVPRIIMTRDDG
eukprot:GHVU01226317.1.p2 GENE.GHVU01226317.1~~GHVU01226317.1.p2  ORF type:complete len:135 (-),score=5.78 GHVU01226317.1:2451-2855(-)